MPEGPAPLFLLSLPRSGSTLLQRLLASHEGIATVSEPWVLLPFLYSLRTRGIQTEYSHLLATRAIEDFAESLPGGVGQYRKEIGELAVRLYRHLSPPGTVYFLDKTPRYHLIADDLFEIFANGKFVFLWRNPLSIVASMLESLGAPGRWDLYLRKIDLYTGLENLINTHQMYSERAISLRFEDLLEAPERQLANLFDYLELPNEGLAGGRFNDVELSGRLGDRAGVEAYSTLSKEPLDKWQSVITNPWRRQWCRSYLRWIGGERLATMGYDMDTLIQEIDNAESNLNHLGSDITWAAYGAAVTAVEPHRFKDRFRHYRRGHEVHVYS